MRIRDWSSDVCSSDLRPRAPDTIAQRPIQFLPHGRHIAGKPLRIGPHRDDKPLDFLIHQETSPSIAPIHPRKAAHPPARASSPPKLRPIPPEWPPRIHKGANRKAVQPFQLTAMPPYKKAPPY